MEWEKIFTTQLSSQADIIKGSLEAEGIEVVLMDKKDSSYLFGKIELYVLKKDLVRAKELLDNAIN